MKVSNGKLRNFESSDMETLMSFSENNKSLKYCEADTGNQCRFYFRKIESKS